MFKSMFYVIYYMFSLSMCFRKIQSSAKYIHIYCRNCYWENFWTYSLLMGIRIATIIKKTFNTLIEQLSFNLKHEISQNRVQSTSSISKCLWWIEISNFSAASYICETSFQFISITCWYALCNAVLVSNQKNMLNYN